MCRCLQNNDVLSQRDDRLKRRGEQAVALAVFKIIASISVPILVVIYFAQGDRSMGLLDRLKTWLAQNNAVIVAMLLLVIGLELVGDGRSAHL
jgi:Sap, sulfolipid-1-addressing protein